LNEHRIIGFLRTAGRLGGGSVVLAVILFVITGYEHFANHNIVATYFTVLGVVFFCIGAYLAWLKEHKSFLNLQEKMMADAPRMSIEIELGKGEAPVKIRIRNVGATEMHSACLDPIIIAGEKVSFPNLIDIIPPGGVSRDLLPTGPGILGRHDLRLAMMNDWDSQGGLKTRLLSFPATGSFRDHFGNLFHVSWNYEMDPIFSHMQGSRERKPKPSFIPDASEYYLAVRTVTQKHVPNTE
jgi:hypothetical protein